MAKTILVYLIMVVVCVLLAPALVTGLFGNFNEGYTNYDNGNAVVWMAFY